MRVSHGFFSPCPNKASNYTSLTVTWSHNKLHYGWQAIIHTHISTATPIPKPYGPCSSTSTLCPSPPLPAPARFPLPFPSFFCCPSLLASCPVLTSALWHCVFIWIADGILSLQLTNIYGNRDEKGTHSVLGNLRGCCRESCKKNNYNTMLTRNKIHKCHRGGRNTEVLLQYGKEQLSVLRAQENKGRPTPTP